MHKAAPFLWGSDAFLNAFPESLQVTDTLGENTLGVLLCYAEGA